MDPVEALYSSRMKIGGNAQAATDNATLEKLLAFTTDSDSLINLDYLERLVQDQYETVHMPTGLPVIDLGVRTIQTRRL